jgi:hypothetical protein
MRAGYKRIFSLGKKNKTIINIASVILIIITAIVIINYYSIIIGTPKTLQKLDRFGVREIYPTKSGGREWYVNMNNPKDDRLFSVTSNIPIVKQSDGSWKINDSEVRLNVITLPGEKGWKNVEMTGYVKVLAPTTSFLSNSKIQDNESEGTEEKSLIPDLDWRARGGRHSSKVPCVGTSLNGGLYMNGIAAWKKEIWHTGGYTDARGVVKATDSSIIGRWIGWKVIIYNINNNNAVKMESYIDDRNNNEWKKVNQLIDSGGWYANSPDKIFYSAGCNRPKDYIITNPGPIATFRSDNIAWDFKYLSIREIQAT